MKSDVRTYRVADFCFTVENMPFEPDNMLPFIVSDGDCGERVFSLKVVPELPVCGKGGLLYKTPEKPGYPVFNIYTVDGGYLFEYQPVPERPIAGRMVVSEAFDAACLELTGTADLYAINNSLMLMFSFSTARRGALEMHASVAVNGGRGYLFLGKSGTGKSTHSQLWIKHLPGTELLNDDNPVLRVMPSGEVRVYGTPWSGKTPCYKQQNAPVGAIVHLQQAPRNKITRQSVLQAYVSLVESSSAFRPFKELADGWHATMERLCATIPFYRLECLPDREAALLCYNTVNGEQNPA
ncbi:MAG: hypothetical protein J5693_03705 [Bacteroidales bacterium]|nr:hypothetical protein [Bacteroidales bacterium]